MGSAPITALFTDVGGVLGTNGWDSAMRKRAADHFALDLHDLDSRHNLTFDTYEEGKLSLDAYLDRTVFYIPRPFTKADFRAYMFDQSQPFPEMIQWVAELKKRCGLKIGVVSNEGRELMQHRIEKFRLAEFVDFFIVSCFVHFRKPDADIFRMAIDIAQVPPEQTAYLEDRPMFVDVANSLGLRGIRHTDLESSRKILEPMLAGSPRRLS